MAANVTSRKRKSHDNTVKKEREISLKSGRKKSDNLYGTEDFLKLPIQVQISCEVTDT